MKIRKQIIRVLMLTLALALLIVAPAAASSKKKKTINKKALKAYKKVLEKGYCTKTYSNGDKYKYKIKEFSVIDINRDGIKEMITQEDKWSMKSLWVLKNNKAKRVADFGSFQGCSIVYSKKGKAVCYPISMTAGIDADGFLRMSSRTKVNCFEYGTRYSWDENTQRTVAKSSWYINGKQVTEKVFWKKATVKSFNDSKVILFYANNATNRKKIKKLKAY